VFIFQVINRLIVSAPLCIYRSFGETFSFCHQGRYTLLHWSLWLFATT